MPRPQVPRQENKVNNNIKVEMEKRLLSHQLDVSGGRVIKTWECEGQRLCWTRDLTMRDPGTVA